MTAEWTYLVADLLTGVIGAELPLSNVSMTKTLNDAGTFSGTLFLGRTGGFKGDAYALTTPARTAIYALRDGTPFWGGILWASRYDSTNASVDIGGADWWSYFDHRKIVPLLDTTDGPSAVAAMSTTYAATEINQIARNLLTLAQTHTNGNLGMQLDSSATGLLTDMTYDGYSLTGVGDALRALTKLTGGPDIRFDVGNPSDDSNRPSRLMLVGNPRLAQDGDPLVIEYGGNLISYTWPRDGSSMATRGYAVGSGTEQATPVSIHEATSRYVDGWPLLEEETGYDTISDGPTLTSYARADVAAADLPKVVPTLIVNSEMDPKLGQYAPGWESRLLIKDAYFVNGLDTTVRIVQLNVQPADGVEQTALAVNAIEDVA